MINDFPNNTNRYIIITTIFPKSEAISLFEKENKWHLIIVGDKKSPNISSSQNLTFLSIDDQLQSGLLLANQCPFNHYARKNLGYLYAFQKSADLIFDTDDDNLPYPDWKLPDFSCNRRIESGNKYINIYRYFSNENIWPRGFPLDELQSAQQTKLTVTTTPDVKVGVWQGITDDQPDTDALYWLIIGKQFKFEKKERVYLPLNSLCPINSQNTFWRKEMFPYLYLPVTTSFRITDILRGYVAQILMGKQGFHTGFTHATLYQKRNPHNLLKDLADEFDLYLNIKKTIEVLEHIPVSGDNFDNLKMAYEALIEASLISKEEINYVNAWIDDGKKILSL